METYRDTPPDDGKRRFVDLLMKRSLKDAQNDPEGKKYHNLIVLRYISSTKRAKKPICDALHISRARVTTYKGREIQSYEAATNNAIDRLLVLAFGKEAGALPARFREYPGSKPQIDTARYMLPGIKIEALPPPPIRAEGSLYQHYKRYSRKKQEASFHAAD